ELATFGFVVRRSIQLSYGRTSRSVGACGSESLPQEREGGGRRGPDAGGPGLSGPGAPGAPEGLARFRQGVDRVVVLVAPRDRVGVVGLEGGAIVFRPVRDALFAIVVRELVHPALADERHVADDARRGEARQVS